MVESMLLDGFYFFSNLVVVSGFSDLFSISIALFCLFFFFRLLIYSRFGRFVC